MGRRGVGRGADGGERAVRVDVDDARVRRAACGVRAMPTFQFWLNGKKMEEFSGGDEGSRVRRRREGRLRQA